MNRTPALTPTSIAALCFFLSGSAGIIFETVWARGFGLILGNSLHGISVVVGLFLGGLGVGAALATRFADKVSRPIQLYARIEAAIGLWGLAGILLLPALPKLLSAILPVDHAVGLVPTAARAAAAVIFLAPPTLLMGMTLPLLSAGLAKRERFLSSLGFLYGLNTVGAFVGTILGGFVLLPALGASWAAAVAASLNFTVLLLASRIRTTPSADGGALPQEGSSTSGRVSTTLVPTAEDGAARAGASGSAALLWLLFSLTGCLALMSEIAWTRALSLILGSSSYTFCLILAVYLFGGGAGALLWRYKKRSLRDPLRTYGLLWILFGLAVLLSIVTLDHAGDIFLRLYALTSTSRPLILGGLFLLASAAVLPPALLLGLHFPLTGEVFHHRGGASGQAAGQAFLWNSVGAFAGSILTAFAILPALGTAGTLRAIASVSLVLGGCLFAFRLPAGIIQRSLCAAAIVAGALLLPFLGPGLDRLLREQGVFRQVDPDLARTLPLKDFLERARAFENRRMLFLEEGYLSTVGVWDMDGNISLTVGGKVDASLTDMETQLLAGHVPMLLHPHPERVLVIGYGSGITADAVLAHHPASLEVAEIEPAVMRAASFYGPWTSRAKVDGAFRLLKEDGRLVLTYGSTKYDMIISEPSNPWIAGVNALFTQDFYRIVRSRLEPGGVFCQWVQVYELSPDTMGSILRSLRSVFPGALFFEAGGDLLCVAGKDGPPKLDARVWERARSGAVRDDLEKVGISSPEDLLVRLIRDSGEAVSPGPLNTDQNGYVEFRAPWEIAAFMPAGQCVRIVDLQSQTPLKVWRDAGWAVETPEGLKRLVDAARLRGNPDLAWLAMSEWASEVRPIPDDLVALGPKLETIRSKKTAVARAEYLQTIWREADALWQQRRYKEAIAPLKDALDLAPRSWPILFRLLTCFDKTGDDAGFRDHLDLEIRRSFWSTRYEVFLNKGYLDLKEGKTEAAETDFRVAVATNPYRDSAYILLQKLLLRQQRVSEARALAVSSAEYLPPEKSAPLFATVGLPPTGSPRPGKP